MEQSIQTDRVAAYLDELRPHLDDLDPSERAEVLDELADALREVAAEHDEPLHEVLGPPADYAAAYRASAGLEHGRPQRTGRLRRLAATVRAQRWWSRLHAFGVLLQPAWWTVRGAVLAVLLGGVLGLWSSPAASLVGVVLVVAGVAASLSIGASRRRSAGSRALLLATNLLAVIAALALVSMAGADQKDPEPNSAGIPIVGQLLTPNGDVVTNIHPYARDGEPLNDVLLFDDAGRPLNVAPDGVDFAVPGIEIEYARDADGRPITNLYPLQQSVIEEDPGEAPTRRPRTAPTIVLPPQVRSDAPVPDDSPR